MTRHALELGVCAFLVAAAWLALAIVHGCYKCRTPDCRELPMPPEPAFVDTRARDAGGG